LEKAGLFRTGWFNKPYVDALWREHQSGLRDHSYPLFALLSFAHWHKRFMGSEPLEPAGTASPGAPGTGQGPA
jgi:hypothetical protein